MHGNNFEMIVGKTQQETFDNIAFIHTLVYEQVEKLGGDDYDYDECLDLLYKQN